MHSPAYGGNAQAILMDITLLDMNETLLGTDTSKLDCRIR